jgi:hypothetical protein
MTAAACGAYAASRWTAGASSPSRLPRTVLPSSVTTSHPAACRPESHRPINRSNASASRSRNNSLSVDGAGVFPRRNPNAWANAAPRSRPNWEMAASDRHPPNVATMARLKTDTSG